MPSGPWLRGPAGFPPGGVVGVLVDYANTGTHLSADNVHYVK